MDFLSKNLVIMIFGFMDYGDAAIAARCCRLLNEAFRQGRGHLFKQYITNFQYYLLKSDLDYEKYVYTLIPIIESNFEYNLLPFVAAALKNHHHPYLLIDKLPLQVEKIFDALSMSVGVSEKFLMDNIDNDYVAENTIKKSNYSYETFLMICARGKMKHIKMFEKCKFPANNLNYIVGQMCGRNEKLIIILKNMGATKCNCCSTDL